ncbi:hypothetical protein MTR62_00770 [Novosphingobium sp. 1949]|uniref:Uncharacterized protein n=1 Tax=Novosphingobium organovorum TaxID=2930092 RepID=A0ABT0B881_9SPHN|nr:hypothetical protein [Novosphingobium organovorum]MCJ2181247.1 hypothetical protein [Novosphingobium organovorum]
MGDKCEMGRHCAGTDLSPALSHEWNQNCSRQARALVFETGMISQDIDAFLTFSTRGPRLIIIRCPSFTTFGASGAVARGTVTPKPVTIKEKSDALTRRLTTPEGREHVSDYDLPCLYTYGGVHRR